MPWFKTMGGGATYTLPEKERLASIKAKKRYIAQLKRQAKARGEKFL